MPTLEYKDLYTGNPYVTVAVKADEIIPGTGRSLGYPAWIGCILSDGTINTWTPCAPVFRGYRAAAEAWLKRLAADPTTRARFARP